MSKQDNIFLVGPMGAGKTSVGKYLAKRSNLPFYDSDHEIEATTGVTISWIFEVETEAGFREREKEMIDELTQHNGIILSTGGGAIVTPENCENLVARGIVIYLSVSLAVQLQRTHRKSGRPLIDVPDPEQKLRELNAEREPIYQRIADFTYSTDVLEPHEIANLIWADVDAYRKKAAGA